MSDFKNKFRRYIKSAGAGSMLISIIVHVIVIIGATVWVVSSVHPQRKALFKGGDNAGSPVQHPIKMSNTQPKLDTLNKRLSVDSPSSTVALPDLPSNQDSGVGSPTLNINAGNPGAAGGLRGPLMPLFGFKEAQPGGTLEGQFYDLKQFRSHKDNPDLAKMGPTNLAISEVSNFVKRGWSNSVLVKFFKAPTTLYATQIFVPVMMASEAPKAYGVEKEVKPMAWIAHYRGKVSPPATGTYRFVGAGDDLMAVRLNGRLVLDCGGSRVSDFKPDRLKAFAYPYAFGKNSWLISNRGGFSVGNRMDLSAGQFYDIDIVFSEGPGGLFCAMLLFEQENVAYEKDTKGNPILPIFRVAPSKTPVADTAPKFMADGPIWRALPAPKD